MKHYQDELEGGSKFKGRETAAASSTKVTLQNEDLDATGRYSLLPAMFLIPLVSQELNLMWLKEKGSEIKWFIKVSVNNYVSFRLWFEDLYVT